MNFDWASLIIFSGIVSSFLTIVVSIITYNSRKSSLVFFIGTLFCIDILLIERIVRFSDIYLVHPSLLYISSPFFFFILPLLYWFQHSMVAPLKRWYVHFIIPIFLLIIFPSFRMSASEKLSMLASRITDPVWLVAGYFIFVATYSMLIFRINKRHKKVLYDNYSDEGVGFQLMANRSIFLSTLLTFCLPLYLSVQYFEFAETTLALLEKWLMVLFSFSTHLILVSIILAPKRQTIASTSINSNEIKHPAEINESKLMLIKNHVKEKEYYLNQDLTLTELAEELEIGRSHLSALINQGFKQNFYDFINGYRIDHIEERMIKGDLKMFSLESIVLDAGFKSYTSFYRVFRRVKGCSPKAYIDSL